MANFQDCSFDEFIDQLDVVLIDPETVDSPVSSSADRDQSKFDLLPYVAQFSLRFVENMCITNPFMSECGRFLISPEDEYGISENNALLMCSLNKTLYDFQSDEIDRLALAAQRATGSTDGGPAAIYLQNKGDEVFNAVTSNAKLLASLMLNELKYGASPDLSDMKSLVHDLKQGSSSHPSP